MNALADRLAAPSSKPADPIYMPSRSSITLFGVDIDVADMKGAVEQLNAWIAEPTSTCRYVVTPNVDHAVMLQDHEEFKSAYKDASLVLPDGQPIVVASRLLGKSLPERVTGADLVEKLFASADPARPLKTFLLGAGPGVAAKAAERIHETWKGVEVVDVYSPPMGFEKDEAELKTITARIRAAAPDVLIIGLGAPKQEIWVHRHRHELNATIALCVGASIDFLAGEKSRAPAWMQRTGLEWLFRMGSEPKRLARRYVLDAWVFPQLVWREWRNITATSDGTTTSKSSEYHSL